MAKKKKKSKVYKNVEWKFPLTKKNLYIAAVGLALILIGFLLMSTGIGGEYAKVDGKWNNPWAITVAPLLLVIGYCVIIPIAIFKYFPKSEQKND